MFRSLESQQFPRGKRNRRRRVVEIEVAEEGGRSKSTWIGDGERGSFDGLTVGGMIWWTREERVLRTAAGLA